GSERHGHLLTANRRIHGGVASDDTLPRKSLHECLSILEVGIFPRRAIQPETATRRVRQRHIFSVDELTRCELWHERAHLEPDAKPIALRGAVDRPGFRLRAAQGEESLAPVSRHSDLKMARRDREKHRRAIAVTTPYPINDGP